MRTVALDFHSLGSRKAPCMTAVAFRSCPGLHANRRREGMRKSCRPHTRNLELTSHPRRELSTNSRSRIQHNSRPPTRCHPEERSDEGSAVAFRNARSVKNPRFRLAGHTARIQFQVRRVTRRIWRESRIIADGNGVRRYLNRGPQPKSLTDQFKPARRLVFQGSERVDPPYPLPPLSAPG